MDWYPWSQEALDKAKAEDKTSVEEKIKALKEVKDKDEVEAIKKAMDELSSAIQKVGAAMYESGKSDQSDKSANQNAGAAGASSDTPNPDKPGADKGPVDADFKEVK